MPRKDKRPRRYLVVIPVAGFHQTYDIPELDYRQHVTIESMVGWVVLSHTPRNIAGNRDDARAFIREVIATEHKHVRHEIVYVTATPAGMSYAVDSDPSTVTLSRPQINNHKLQ